MDKQSNAGELVLSSQPLGVGRTVQQHKKWIVVGLGETGNHNQERKQGELSKHRK